MEGQGTGTRTNAVYAVLVDETWVASITGAVDIGSIDVTGVGGSSRGVSFGDATYPAANQCNVNVQSVRIVNATGRTAVAGFGVLNVEGPANVSADTVRLVGVDTFHAYHQGASAKCKVSMMDLGDFKALGILTYGKLTAHTILGNRTGLVAGSANTVEVNGSGANGTHIVSLDIATTAAHAGRCLFITGATDCAVDKLKSGQFATSGGAVCINSAPRTKLTNFYVPGPGTSGTGLQINSSTDLLLERGVVTGFATGVGASGTNGGTAVAVKVTGNTTNTAMPAGTFTELGNTTFQLAA